MKVFLTGFSGSGKSTVGPKLARALKYDYIDCDTEIEKAAGMSVPQIFAEKGEIYFRQLEHQIVQQLTRAECDDAVIGLGGGAFIAAKNRKLIRAAGVTVYLRCEVKELYRRLRRHRDRPLLFGPDITRAEVIEQMRKLLCRRKRFYELADITVSTTITSASEAARQIRRRLREYDR